VTLIEQARLDKRQILLSQVQAVARPFSSAQFVWFLVKYFQPGKLLCIQWRHLDAVHITFLPFNFHMFVLGMAPVKAPLRVMPVNIPRPF
jgi:hypothetical protein